MVARLNSPSIPRVTNCGVVSVVSDSNVLSGESDIAATRSARLKKKATIKNLFENIFIL